MFALLGPVTSATAMLLAHWRNVQEKPLRLNKLEQDLTEFQANLGRLERAAAKHGHPLKDDSEFCKIKHRLARTGDAILQMTRCEASASSGSRVTRFLKRIFSTKKPQLDFLAKELGDLNGQLNNVCIRFLDSVANQDSGAYASSDDEDTGLVRPSGGGSSAAGGQAVGGSSGSSALQSHSGSSGSSAAKQDEQVDDQHNVVVIDINNSDEKYIDDCPWDKAGRYSLEQDNFVYRVRGNNTYHLGWCFMQKKASFDALTLADAQRDGLKACKFCVASALSPSLTPDGQLFAAKSAIEKTDSGRYHHQECPSYKRSSQATVSVEQAERKHMIACGVCCPPSVYTLLQLARPRPGQSSPVAPVPDSKSPNRAPAPTSPSISGVAQRFVANPISDDLKTVPGIGRVNASTLQQNEITKTDHLVGHFFRKECDINAFSQFLTELGIERRYADECAKRMSQKFIDNSSWCVTQVPANSTFTAKAQKFLTQPLSDDIKSVPGIGKAMASALSEHDVTHPMHLVALFFLCERDEIKFILSLEEHSVKNKYARDCAEAFVHKFRNI